MRDHNLHMKCKRPMVLSSPPGLGNKGSKFSKHWITGSDFSELALLESSLNELASSMEDVNLNINKKKMANFK